MYVYIYIYIFAEALVGLSSLDPRLLARDLPKQTKKFAPITGKSWQGHHIPPESTAGSSYDFLCSNRRRSGWPASGWRAV